MKTACTHKESKFLPQGGDLLICSCPLWTASRPALEDRFPPRAHMPSPACWLPRAGHRDSPLISFMFIPFRAFPASRTFLNCTKAKPRSFPSGRQDRAQKLPLSSLHMFPRPASSPASQELSFCPVNKPTEGPGQSKQGEEPLNQSSDSWVHPERDSLATALVPDIENVWLPAEMPQTDEWRRVCRSRISGL